MLYPNSSTSLFYRNHYSHILLFHPCLIWLVLNIIQIKVLKNNLTINMYRLYLIFHHYFSYFFDMYLCLSISSVLPSPLLLSHFLLHIFLLVIFDIFEYNYKYINTNWSYQKSLTTKMQNWYLNFYPCFLLLYTTSIARIFSSHLFSPCDLWHWSKVSCSNINVQMIYKFLSQFRLIMLYFFFILSPCDFWHWSKFSKIVY